MDISKAPETRGGEGNGKSVAGKETRTTVLRSVVFGVAFWSLRFALAFWLLKVAFCLLEDLTAFCLKISLRFASRPHCVLLQDIHCVLLEDLTAFCFKTSLRFASSYHCVLLQYHCVLLKTSIAFCLKTILRFDRNNSDDIQAAGSDTRPPMLDRTDYESWSQRIRLYCRGKENGLQILQSIDQGPFELGTTRDALGTTPEGGVLLGPERPRTYEEGTVHIRPKVSPPPFPTPTWVNEQAGNPKSLHWLKEIKGQDHLPWAQRKKWRALINYCSLLTQETQCLEPSAVVLGEKEKWFAILQSIDQGPFELGTIRDTLGTTSEDGVLIGPEMACSYDDLNDDEKKRYDADVHATNIVLQGLPTLKQKQYGTMMLPGENINEYYVRFHKLVNDMRNIRMTMPNIQLNSKFVNNMSPEWDRFVTAVKLNKGLKETNHEQLYAYLKQHEKHAAQDRLIIERITPSTNDPLAFVSTTIQDGQIVVQNVQGRQNQNQRHFARGNGAAGFGGMQNRAGNANAGQGKPVKCYNCNGVGHIARNCTQPKRPQNSDYFKDKMLLMQAQENGAVLDEEELLFLAGEQGNTFDADVDNQPVQDLALNEDNIFQADECDAFDSDVDDEPTAQTIFMANLSSAGSANPQAGPSNASILSEVHTLENAIDHSVTNQNEHEIHNEVQQSNVIDSTSVHMGNSNVIPYEQYLTTNDVSVVPSCASSAPNNAYVLIDNNVHTPHEPLVTELAIYKEQVAIYEQRAKFELTEREQRMDDQMRVLIQDRNRMEEKLKQELHSVKLQLNHSIKSQTVVQENVNTLQQTFKQRESQLLNDFSNLRKLKDKLENKLHAQDQSIQTVHMMLKPKRLCDQYSELPIGAQNPFYLKKAKVAQLALYDGNELINVDHDPIDVPSSEEGLELAKLTR
ncbi:retrovirus-related pol polyprotein from transposon TNT 1-94 [Tanacetum coccineum]